MVWLCLAGQAAGQAHRLARLSLPASRLLCSAPPVTLEEHTFSVPSFGGVLDMRSNLSVSVAPTCPSSYPNMDRALLKVTGPSPSCAGEVSVSVSQEENKLSVGACCASPSLLPQLAASCNVPMVHNVNIAVTGEAKVSCRDMVESDYCHICAEEGEVTLTALKTRDLNVRTQQGAVKCQGAIQGSVSISTQGGSVTSNKRFTGPSLDISTDTGDISVASCYSDQSKFVTQEGNLALKNLHNESYVAVYQQGNVTIQGLDGSTSVFVKKGDLSLQVSRVKAESRVHAEEGNITLKMTDSAPIKLCITAEEIVTDETFSKYGKVELKPDNYYHYLGDIHPHEFSPTFQVITEKGKVVVESKSWADGLGLKLPKEEAKR